MPSPTEVINHALDMVNVSPINNIDDAEAKTQKCKRIYDMSLTIQLEKDDWRFGVDRVSLAADATAPIEEWTNAFTLPADCRKPIRINDDDSEPWEQEGNKVLTDAASPIILTYVKNVTDPNRWTAAFIESFTSYLASRYAKAFPQDNDKAEKQWQEYKDNLGEAIAKNGQTGTPPRPTVSTLTTAIRRY